MKKILNSIETWLFDVDYYLRFSENNHLFALHRVLFRFLYRNLTATYTGERSYRKLLWEVIFPPKSPLEFICPKCGEKKIKFGMKEYGTESEPLTVCKKCYLGI